MLRLPLRVFDRLEAIWEKNFTSGLISTALMVGFLGGLIYVFIGKIGLIASKDHSYFLAIDIAFTILLITEILGLIFVLPKSVADSIGKQFEILSIILLRSAFKEFGSISHPIHWDDLSSYQPILYMLSDAFGALLIFLIIALYYQKQLHHRITKSDDEQEQFIHFKKILGLILLVIFSYLGVMDLVSFYESGRYVGSFNVFYTILIFTDVLILLFSLRYSTRYNNLFRYSSFAFATLMIRISLTAPPIINVSLGILSGLFIVGFTMAYNYFSLQDPSSNTDQKVETTTTSMPE